MFIPPVDGDHAPSVAILIRLWARTPAVPGPDPDPVEAVEESAVPAYRRSGVASGKPRWVAMSNAIVRGD